MRCINCGVATQRLRRHISSSLPAGLHTILARWLTVEVPRDATICHPCYELLNSEATGDVRLLGHTMVCITCGRSVRSVQRHAVERHSSMLQNLPTSHPAFHQAMNYACHPCWMRHQRHTNQDQNQVNMPGPEPRAEPEPLPEPAPRPVPDLELNLPNCKRAATPPDTEDSALSENEIKVFCPKCDTKVSHTAGGIQEDQRKILIANVYHYFEQEYEELKTIYGDLDLTPLSKFRQRTALATGVSETTVLQILKEEEERKADKRQEPPKKRRRARKRSRQKDSSREEDSSDDNVDDNHPSSNGHEAQTLVVKVESPECYNEEPEIYVPFVKLQPSDIEVNKEQAETDPISIDVKTEPRSDVVDNANETLALNEPAGTKRKARKIPRSDVTSTRQHTQGESSSTAAASSVRLTEQLDESRLFGDTEMKTEEIEILEEGVS